MGTNTFATLADASIETIVALDAVEANDPRAHLLLIGVPCTISIGSDHYPAEIVKATPSLHTLEVAYTGRGGLSGDVRTFRKNKGGYYTSSKHFHLTIGTARTYMDPGF